MKIDKLKFELNKLRYEYTKIHQVSLNEVMIFNLFQLHGFKPSSHRIFRLNNIAKVLTFLEERNVRISGMELTRSWPSAETHCLCE